MAERDEMSSEKRVGLLKRLTNPDLLDIIEIGYVDAQDARQELEHRITTLEFQESLASDLNEEAVPANSPTKAKKKHRLSAAGLARIKAANKKRWAKERRDKNKSKK